MFKLVNLSRTFFRLTDSFTTTQKINNRIINNNSLISSPYLLQSLQNYCNQSVESNLQIEGLNEDVRIQDITNGDEELERKLRVLVLETDVMRQEGSKIPDTLFLKTQHWKELIDKTTKSQRKKYLEFLWKIEKKKENKKSKQEQARIERETRPEYVDDGHIRYGLNHNTIYIRIYDSTINHLYNSHLVTAMQFGQPLVIDCGYDDNMNSRECTNCSKQIMLAFAENRMNDNPFDLHLCNVNYQKNTYRSLAKYIATINEPWFPLHVHNESYSNIKYPSLPYLENISDRTKAHEIPANIKERLVYLTPHCREELREYDHDAIYIIGGIVDKVNQEPLSLAKAKREGLRMAKLPLDRYLQWGDGSGKSLTLNQMILILLDIKNTGDWEYALRHVPRRKVLGSNTNTYKMQINKDVERNGPAYDRNSHSKMRSNRSFDNLRQKQSTKSTSDLIRHLMKS